MSNERKYHRLRNWDYSSAGIYYITICCYEKHCYLGSIKNNNVILSEIGAISSSYWLEIPSHFPHAQLDEFIIMPNHIHGLIIIDNSLPDQNITIQNSETGPKNKINRFSQPIKNSVSVIINQYKSSVTRWCNKNGFKNFQWQTRFYDEILHNEIALEKVREYIRNNPSNWLVDD